MYVCVCLSVCLSLCLCVSVSVSVSYPYVRKIKPVRSLPCKTPPFLSCILPSSTCSKTYILCSVKLPQCCPSFLLRRNEEKELILLPPPLPLKFLPLSLFELAVPLLRFPPKPELHRNNFSEKVQKGLGTIIVHQRRVQSKAPARVSWMVLKDFCSLCCILLKLSACCSKFLRCVHSLKINFSKKVNMLKRSKNLLKLLWATKDLCFD